MKAGKQSPVSANSSEGVFFCSPFGLLGRLKQADAKPDMVAVLDLIVIALLVSLVFTRFVVVPGVQVELPVTGLRMHNNEDAVAVLTIQNRGMLFFNGSVYDEYSLDRAFSEYIASTRSSRAVLLVKAEANIVLQQFLEICRKAELAGFKQLQLSGKKLEELPDLIPQQNEAGALDSFQNMR